MSQRFPMTGGTMKSTTLDGSGNGFVILGPEYADQIWHISGIATLVSSSNNEPRFNVYQGKSPGQINFKGGSITGSNDSSDFKNLVIYHGDAIYGEWRGGDPGAAATMVISGEVEIP